MRKITLLAAQAFFEGKEFKQGNTAVTIEGEDVRLELHGNQIASRRMYRGLTLYVSMCGWGTPTTRERLHGLLPKGLGIGQHKGVQVWRAWDEASPWHKYNGQPVDTDAVYIVNVEKYTIKEW